MSSKYCNLNMIFIYCNLFVFKILGLLPWKINLSSMKAISHSDLNKRKNNSSAKLMNTSTWGPVYSVVLITVNLLSSIYALQDFAEINEASKMPIVIKAVHVDIAKFEIFSVTCVWILYILRKKTILRINKQLVEAGRMLNCFVNYHWQVTPRLTIIFLINSGVSVILAIIELGFVNFFFMFSWCISVLASAWVLIQYALILEMIHHQLKMINKEILNLGNIPDNIKIRNIFISKFPMRRNSERNIVNLKYAYVHICEICNELSDFYAIPVLLCIIFFGFVITFTAYFNFYGFYVAKNPSTILGLAGDCMWFFVIASAIITLVTVVNSVKKEISIIPDHIHQLLNLCSASDHMENALIEFSYDLLSRKINFTAYGIASLDGSLLFSILGSSMTYIVILIQFQLK